PTGAAPPRLAPARRCSVVPDRRRSAGAPAPAHGPPRCGVVRRPPPARPVRGPTRLDATLPRSAVAPRRPARAVRARRRRAGVRRGSRARLAPAPLPHAEGLPRRAGARPRRVLRRAPPPGSPLSPSRGRHGLTPPLRWRLLGGVPPPPPPRP